MKTMIEIYIQVEVLFNHKNLSSAFPNALNYSKINISSTHKPNYKTEMRET